MVNWSVTDAVAMDVLTPVISLSINRLIQSQQSQGI
jgi:6-phosphogluconate dehydrogenase (decarboxylating)